MKKGLLFFVLACALLPMSAQMQSGLKGTYNLDKFPKVSFVWSTANPKEISPSVFSLSEDGKKVDFTCTALPVDTTSLNKSVLILWEDMASHKGQSQFVQNVLLNFFNETTISAGDRFEVAVFDRVKEGNDKVLKQKTGGFTNDLNRLRESIQRHQFNDRTNYDDNLRTDLYLAIDEGLDILMKESAGRGVIIVFTKGNNLDRSGAKKETEPIIQKALNAGIPIYVVKYTNASDTPEINNLAESAYGKVVTTAKTNVAIDALKQLYGNMDQCLHGRDYKIAFTTKAERDGKAHHLELVVERVPHTLPSFTAPEVTFGEWIGEHLLLSIVIVLAFIALVILLCVLLVKRRKAHINRIQGSMQAKLDKAQSENEEILRRNREAMEKMKRDQEEKERARATAEEEQRLFQLMNTKNLYPRLQCKTGATTFIYTIRKPHVTLGRKEDNDVAFNKKTDTFNNQTVSGYHAEIVFNGASFELFNKSTTYKQGIIVNGGLYQHCTLRNGDMIGIGEAVVTFYV